MVEVRKAADRGGGKYGWLSTQHTFSFAGYWDDRYMGFGALRVINEDRVAPGRGFGPHPHRDMEIISYVVSGAMEHRDSAGHTSVIAPGRLQRMTAGTGIVHSEMNDSDTEPLHFLQIWLLPDQRGLEPSYEEVDYSLEPADSLSLVVSPRGEHGAGRIHQDAQIYAGRLRDGARFQHRLDDRNAWVQVVDGLVSVNSHTLELGDGAAITEEQILDIEALSEAEVLVFDLA